MNYQEVYQEAFQAGYEAGKLEGRIEALIERLDSLLERMNPTDRVVDADTPPPAQPLQIAEKSEVQG